MLSTAMKSPGSPVLAPQVAWPKTTSDPRRSVAAPQGVVRHVYRPRCSDAQALKEEHEHVEACLATLHGWCHLLKACPMVVLFYKGLHCDSLLQRITLSFPSAEDYIVIPF